jgi:hypothetical protein
MGWLKNIFPKQLRGYITDNKTGVRTEITDDITNWREINVKQLRTDFSGVYTELQQSIAVCRAAKALVQNAFHTHMLGMDMTFEIERRVQHLTNGVRTYSYERIHSMRLNPGTYKEYAEYIEIEGKSLTFDALLRSVGKTKYDIPVPDGSPVWRYYHNQMFSSGGWTMPGSVHNLIFSWNGVTLIRFQPLINFDFSEMVMGGVANDFRTQDLAIGLDSYFFKSDAPAQTVWVSFDYDVPFANFTGRTEGNAFTLNFAIVGADGSIKQVLLSKQDSVSINPIVNFAFSGNVTLDAGDRLTIYAETTVGWSGASGRITGRMLLTEVSRLNIKYVDKPFEVVVEDDGDEVVQPYTVIQAVTPLALANTLLSKMANGDTAKTYTAQIDTDTDNPWSFNHYLVAAESIREFEDAKFHANFNDFLEYMQFLGYEYETDETTRVVHFRKRAEFFNPSITALELTKGEVSDMEIAADDTYAYSTVRVGYEKPDIENTTGRFAMCGAFDYSTDHVNLGDVKDSSLEIMCPYKADPVEIETLSWTRGEKTKDQKADNDIFMLAGELSDGYVVETRRAEYTVTDADLGQSIGWYNVPYIPYFIAQRNEGRIGIAVRNLTFTGTDAYRDAKLSGTVTVDPYSNLAVEGLFKPITYDFKVGTHKGLPPQALRGGLVRFRWRGGTYQGYTKELIKNDCAEQAENWVLYAK